MNVFSPIRWTLSLGARFFTAVPGTTVAVVFLTLFSQGAMLLATFLPLKTVILLSSESIPRYFPEYLHHLQRNTLITFLCVASFLLFFLYMGSERIISVFLRNGSRHVLANNKKIILFDNQESVSTRAYQRFSRSLAGVVFILFGLSILLFIDWKLAIFLFAAITSVLLFCLFVSVELNISGGRFLKFFQTEKLPHNRCMLVLFLTFIYLVYDNLTRHSVSILAAIISLLLIRQVLGRVSSLISDILGLYIQKPQLMALFYQNHTYHPLSHGSAVSGYWDVVASDWYAGVLEMQGLSVSDQAGSYWVQTGIQDVTTVVAAGTNKKEKTAYFLKLFNTNRVSQGRHEASLFFEIQNAVGFPAPVLSAVQKVDEFHCNIFLWLEDYQRTRNYTEDALQLAGKLLAFEPPQELVSQYLKSRPLLWQRIDEKMIFRLGYAAFTEEDKANLQVLSDNMENIRYRLQCLPYVFVNPDLNANTLWLDKEGQPLVTHWGRWEIEPAGSGWPVYEAALNKLSELCNHYHLRGQIHNGQPEELILSALCFSMESLCQRQLYQDAFKLVPRIVSVINVLENCHLEYVG